MQALFTLDGFTDVEPAPVVREIASIVMDALRNPDKPRPAGEVILGEMMRQCVHTHHKSVVRSTADLTVRSLADAGLGSATPQRPRPGSTFWQPWKAY